MYSCTQVDLETDINIARITSRQCTVYSVQWVLPHAKLTSCAVDIIVYNRAMTLSNEVDFLCLSHCMYQCVRVATSVCVCLASASHIYGTVCTLA